MRYFGRSGEIDPDRAAESRLADLEIDVVENHLMHAPCHVLFAATTWSSCLLRHSIAKRRRVAILIMP